MKDEIVRSLYEIAMDRLHPGAVRAAKELLSCLYPQEFSRVRHVVSHRVDKEPEIDVTALPADELRQFTKLLKKLRGDNEPPKAAPNVIDIVEKRQS